LQAQHLDVARENAAARLEVPHVRGRHGMAFDAIVVPGFTPRVAPPLQGEGPHPFAKERLLRAVLDWRRRLAPFFILTGGKADGAEANEALTMKRYLVAGGIPESRILIEPCALHSHTNLRNTGRLMMSMGFKRALIVTSYDQAFYFTTGWLTGFDRRALKYLGHPVGRLTRYDAQRVTFTPSRRNFERGTDGNDP
jgi:uncharacterized SAM-binding protein YcdF (DUF218 family)